MSVAVTRPSAAEATAAPPPPIHPSHAMTSASGALSASGPPKINALKTPFPRTNTTTRPLPARRPPATAGASSSSSRTLSTTASNRRIPMHSGVTMGAMRPPVAGRRNERFDQLLYTSPLPRSISRAYNDLQAAGGAAAAVTATATATTSMSTVPGTSTGTGTNRAAAIVPSALRMGTMTDGVSASTKVVPRKVLAGATGGAGAGVQARNSQWRVVIGQNGGGEGSQSVQTEPGALPVPVVGNSRTRDIAKTVAPVVPSPNIVMGDSVAAEKAAPVQEDSPAQWFAAEARAKEEGGGHTRDVSGGVEGQDSSARGGAAPKRKTDESRQVKEPPTQAVAHAVKGSGKRTISSSAQSTPPKKVPKTAASSSPGQAHRQPSGRKQIAKPPPPESSSYHLVVAALGKDVPNTKGRLKGKLAKSWTKNPVKQRKSQFKSPKLAPSSHGRTQKSVSTPNPTRGDLPEPAEPPPAAVSKRGKLPRVLPGFQVPPGILDETGSLWDQQSGRRLSRRVSMGVPSTLSHDPVTRERRERKSYPVAVPGDTSAGEEKNAEIPSNRPASAGDTPATRTAKSSISITNGKKKMLLEPDAQLLESKATKHPRNSLAGREDLNGHESLLPNDGLSLGNTTTPAPRRSTRASLVGNKEGGSATKQKSPDQIKSLRKVPALPPPQQEDIQTQAEPSPSPPPVPQPLPLKKTRRSIRNSMDLAVALPGTGPITPATARKLAQTLQQASTGRAPTKTPRVIEETPQATTTTTTATKRTGLARSWVINETPQPAKLKVVTESENARVVEETPQPIMRVTRASTGKAKGRVNTEFEFSDEEVN